MLKILNRLIKKPFWRNDRLLEPTSKVFGMDRGTPIDRYFIEDFLESNKQFINGSVLEISESTYSKKFGQNVISFEILSHANDNPKATIIGDLANIATLPRNKVDCFICTQTLNFIYDFKAAIAGIHHLLKEEGVALVTVAGISQISRYDMDRWGDYWRFTILSVQKMFEDVFGEKNVNVNFYGNVLTSMAFLDGLAAEELKINELLAKDNDYQMTITVVARKRFISQKFD